MATSLCLQDDNRGGYLNVADQTTFPAATTMCGALVKFAPGGLRQMHWHTTLDEWQFVINGTFEVLPNLGVTKPCDMAGPKACVGLSENYSTAILGHGCALHHLLQRIV